MPFYAWWKINQPDKEFSLQQNFLEETQGNKASSAISPTISKKCHCQRDNFTALPKPFQESETFEFLGNNAIPLEKEKNPQVAGQIVDLGYDNKDRMVETSGPTGDDDRKHCKGRGWVSCNFLVRHVQTTTLKFKKGSGKVKSHAGHVLPRAFENFRCEIASLHPYPYLWNYLDKWNLPVLRTEDVNMTKQALTIFRTNAENPKSKFAFEVMEKLKKQRKKNICQFNWSLLIAHDDL